MKFFKIFLLSLVGLFFSGQAMSSVSYMSSAGAQTMSFVPYMYMSPGSYGSYDLAYQVSMTVDAINSDTSASANTSAFGGVNVGDNFSGMFAANSASLAGQDGTSVAVSLPDDGIDFKFDFNIGNHNYHFAYDPARDYIADPDFGFAETRLDVNSGVTGLDGFAVSQYSDADSFEFYLDTTTQRWSAYVPNIDVNVEGTLSVSQVPVPAAVWLFVSGVIGLMGYRKKAV